MGFQRCVNKLDERIPLALQKIAARAPPGITIMNFGQRGVLIMVLRWKEHIRDRIIAHSAAEIPRHNSAQTETCHKLDMSLGLFKLHLETHHIPK